VLVGNNNMLVADDADPILKSHAAEAVRKHGEIELNGSAAPNPSNQCWPEPMPYILWNFGMQMLQRPDKVIILYDEDHEFRQVRMNQPHPAEVAPSWYGDSVGHYEGETLVIDTVGVKVDRPFAMIDMFGTLYTSALHVVERYRLIDYEAAKQAQDRAGTQLYRLPGAAEGWSADPAYKGKGLQLEFTVEDEGVYTMSWSASMTYRRVEREWPERSAPTIRMSIMLVRTPLFRAPTSRISEPGRTLGPIEKGIARQRRYRAGPKQIKTLEPSGRPSARLCCCAAASTEVAFPNPSSWALLFEVFFHLKPDVRPNPWPFFRTLTANLGFLNDNQRWLCATINNNQKTEREAAMRQFMMTVTALSALFAASGKAPTHM
jgi:hypothetical protein